MHISIAGMLLFLFAVAALTVGWLAYTKHDGEENVKKAVNMFSSLLFWGLVFLLIGITVLSSS
ncbi:MAG TPA: hypothetical protein VIR60_00775 [Gammaproteobacteria bacterium]